MNKKYFGVLGYFAGVIIFFIISWWTEGHYNPQYLFNLLIIVLLCTLLLKLDRLSKSEIEEKESQFLISLVMGVLFAFYISH